MIARVWSGQTTREWVPAYADYLRTHVFAGLKRIDGFAEAMLLTRETADGVEVKVITYWRSLDAIRAFSGPDLEAAVVTDQAAALLTGYDHRASHFTVVLREGA